MAKKEKPGEKLIDKRITDGRYNDPLDSRIQERKLDKSLDNLRKLDK